MYEENSQCRMCSILRNRSREPQKKMLTVMKTSKKNIRELPGFGTVDRRHLVIKYMGLAGRYSVVFNNNCFY